MSIREGFLEEVMFETCRMMKQREGKRISDQESSIRHVLGEGESISYQKILGVSSMNKEDQGRK